MNKASSLQWKLKRICSSLYCCERPSSHKIPLSPLHILLSPNPVQLPQQQGPVSQRGLKGWPASSLWVKPALWEQPLASPDNQVMGLYHPLYLILTTLHLQQFGNSVGEGVCQSVNLLFDLCRCQTRNTNQWDFVGLSVADKDMVELWLMYHIQWWMTEWCKNRVSDRNYYLCTILDGKFL